MHHRSRAVTSFLLSLAAVCGSHAHAQVAPPARTADETARALIAEALERGRAFVHLQSLLAAAPSRLAGSGGAQSAVLWAEATMKSIGLANVRQEPCDVPQWIRGSIATLRVAAPDDAQLTKLPIVALGGSVATDAAGLSAEVVEVKSFDELRALGNAARGKFVFFNRPMDPRKLDPFEAYGGAVDQRSRGAIEAAKAGGVGAIVRSMTLRLDDFPHTGAMRYEDGVAQVPSVAISTAGAERLSTLLKRTPKTRLSLTLDCRTEADVPSANVVGEIVGSKKPEEIVLLGAHLDAWDIGVGAHDDGAGCAHVLEAARLMLAIGAQPERTVRICLFMNEENGLRGALAYAKTHADEVERHVLALESDRGGFAPRGIGTNATGATFERLRSFLDAAAGSGADRLFEGGGGADLSPLERQGVLCCEFLPDAQRYFDYHHCGRDTLDAVHPRELELGAGVIAAFAWRAAGADVVLERPAMKR